MPWRSAPNNRTKLVNRAYLAIILLIAAILLFCNLDNQSLWQDEAETAVLARNVLKTGLPEASDGKNTVILLEIPEFSKNYILSKYWMGQPWLAIYITAMSFGIFGINTFTARLPFAFIGLLVIIITYLLSWRLFRNKVISNISVALTAFSVPLLLHFRQCRYFAPGIFLTILCVYLYMNYSQRRRFSLVLLLAALFLLLNTSIGYFLSAASAIVIHMIITDRSSFFSKRNMLFVGVLALYAIPILYLFKLPRRFSSDPHWIFHNLRYYIRSINKYIFPWKILIPLYILYVFIKRRMVFAMSRDDLRSVILLATFIIVSIPFLLPVNFNSLRYIINIVPLFFILEAYIISRIALKFGNQVLFLVLPLLLLTNVFNLSYPVKSYVANYIYEITHDYDGPAEGIVKYLNQNADANDTVKIAHRFDNPIIFYTLLKVDNMPPFESESRPEWIIPNSYWNSGFYSSSFYKKISGQYGEITIPYPDIPWENRPDDMGYHKFRTDLSAPKVKILKRRSL